MKTIFINANIITPFRELKNGVLVVENNYITDICEKDCCKFQANDSIIDAKGMYLSPGFIDMHTHGAGNADFLDGSIEAVCTVCRTHMQYGTTSIMPTTLSCQDEELFANLGNIYKASQIEENMPEIVGVHLEGPYFSPEQNMAQDSKYIKYPNAEEYENVYKHCPIIKRWSVAPELEGAYEMGRWLKKNNIIASIAHTNAVYEDMVLAVENGYTMVTHLFNAMSRLTRKNAVMSLGAAESSLALDDLTVEVIADGNHLPPSLLKMIYKIKGAENICLVTDSMRAAGVDCTESILGSISNGQRVEVADGVAYMPGRRSFGGSIATANRLVRTMHHEANVPLSDAVKMITTVPARLLGIDDRKGSLTIGKDADIILFDNDINIKLVMVKGKVMVNNYERNN